MKNLARVFKALADETRLRLLALLVQEGELCVCDCENALGVTQSKASRHLRMLRDAGLVEDRRETVWVYYRIAEGAVAEGASVLGAVRPLLAAQNVSGERSRLAAWRREQGVARCEADPQAPA